MAIRITRNDAGNCINFIGSSNPAYWNACLSAVINSEDPMRVDIINDIRSENEDEIQYEFYAVNYSDFADKDNNAFTSAQQMVDYVNENANVVGVSGVGADLTDTVVNFRLDQTSTSIIMDNGSSFGVNTIKAVADVDGTIHIHAIGAGQPSDEQDAHEHKHFEKLDHTNVQINHVAATGGLNDVVNQLNELFTVGPFEAVVISDPYATRVADQTGVSAGYTLEGIDVVDPTGDDLATSTKNSHKAGIKSTATISEPGEFYTFQIRGEGQIGFGLVHTQDSYDAGLYSGNATYADPAQYKVGNSQHHGFQFSHHFHPTPNGPWTNYGANTAYSMREGWSNATHRFISSAEGADWLAGNPVKIKCGIDFNGYISIEYWNQSQERYIPISRSGYPVPDGSEYHLGVSIYNPSARLYSAPLVHHLAATEEVTTIGTDAITAFGDIVGDLAGGVSTPTGVGVNDGIITTETIDSAGEYWEVEVTDNEWSIISLLYHQDNQPATVAAAANAGTLTANDYSFFGGHIQSDGAMNNSVYKSGSGAGIGTSSYPKVQNGVKWRIGFDTDGKATIWQSQDGTTFNRMWKATAAAPAGDYSLYWRGTTAGAGLTSVTKGQLSLAPTMHFRYIESPDDSFVFPLFATAEEANYWNLIKGGTGTSHTHTYEDDPTNTTWYMPDTYNNEAGYHINPNDADTPATNEFDGTPITWTEITSLTNADLTPSQFTNADLTYEEGTAVNIPLQPADTTYTTSVDISPAGSGLVYDSTSKMLQGTLADVGSDTTYTITVTRANSYGSSVGSFTITATNVAPATSHTTPWTKAIRFSGGSERMQQVSSDSNRIPMKMGGVNNNAAAPSTAGYTSSDSNSRPWFTSVVFKLHSYNDNQHIWNVGEGAGAGDDNIYLRRDANRDIWFGWGRDGELNECRVATGLNTTGWHAVYIASTGERVGGGHSAQDIADCFDIRYTSGANAWAIGSNLSTAANWTAGSFGARMNRQFTGDFTIGGRGANRSFRGWVASLVTATLKQGQAMPSSTEIAEIITDPKDWLTNYRYGNTYRLPWQGASTTWNASANDGSTAYATQVWLMGDGTNDSYSNMIRNQVHPSDQNYTKMNMISMVSNDIETVSINGLT